ncbi:MAG TPA: hypothetical protein VJU18_12110 [Vicinamibacteria bacterium]|nr:hypothetical protein [Vicinamibacteria bacterium]
MPNNSPVVRLLAFPAQRIEVRGMAFTNLTGGPMLADFWLTDEAPGLSQDEDNRARLRPWESRRISYYDLENRTYLDLTAVIRPSSLAEALMSGPTPAEAWGS